MSRPPVRQGLSQSALRERTGLDRTTFGQLAGDLEDGGLVHRRPVRRNPLAALFR